MGVLVAAYVAVWLCISLYVGVIGFRQRRLEKRLDALSSMIDQGESHGSSVSSAA
jgi:CcmD family protein